LDNISLSISLSISLPISLKFSSLSLGLGPAARRREDQKVIPLFQVLFLSFSPSLFTVFSLSVHLQIKERKIRKKKG
jgi:hypothetical protein